MPKGAGFHIYVTSLGPVVIDAPFLRLDIVIDLNPTLVPRSLNIQDLLW